MTGRLSPRRLAPSLLRRARDASLRLVHDEIGTWEESMLSSRMKSCECCERKLESACALRRTSPDENHPFGTFRRNALGFLI
jgi:hypothetical protein